MINVPTKLIHIHQIKDEDPVENLSRFLLVESKPSKLNNYIKSITLKPGIHYAVRGIKSFYFENELISNPKRQTICILKNRIKTLIEEHINAGTSPTGKRVDWVSGTSFISAKSFNYNERDNLYLKGINPILNFLNTGLTVFGQKVVTKEGIQCMTKYDYINKQEVINPNFLKLIEDV